MSYTDYLSLDPILGAQNCKSDAHDEEMLFIASQHPDVPEAVDAAFAARAFFSARTHLAQAIRPRDERCLALVLARFFEQLNKRRGPCCAHLTPSEYTDFRDEPWRRRRVPVRNQSAD